MRSRSVLTNWTLGKISQYYFKNISIEQAKRRTQDKSGFAALVDRVVVNATPW